MDSPNGSIRSESPEEEKASEKAVKKKLKKKSKKEAKIDFSVASSDLNMLQHEKVSEMKFKLDE